MASIGEKEEEPGAGAALGARIAGGLLVLNALSFIYAGLALNMPASGRVSSVVVDLVLGGALILGRTKLVPFCLLRVVLGGIFFLGWSIYTDDFVSASLQVLLSGSLLGLLLGTPSVPRIGVSGVAATLYVLGTAARLSFGTYVRSPDALLESREIELIERESIRGRAFDYSLRVPNDDWFLRADDVTLRENPAADRWLVRPDRDAHFIIIAERLGAVGADVGAYRQAVLQNLEGVATRFEILEEGQLWKHYPKSRLVHARALIRGLSIDYALGIVVVQDVGYQFIGFASEVEYPAVADDFKQIQQSITIGSH